MSPTSAPRQRVDLSRFAWLSIAAAITTIALKTGAWWVTGSVGLLSDAAESLVNLIAAIVALIALKIAARPADHNHHFGHAKAEYFSSALEGMAIFAAAAVILWTAVERFLNPREIESVGIGLAISVVASAINGGVAWILLRAGRAHRSITLEADGKHLLTDVWTSVGVVLGVLLVALTGWERLDPIVAFLVGLNIIWTGWTLMRASAHGFMDHALPADENAQIAAVLSRYTSATVSVHGLRTRESGHKRYVDFHLLVPGAWSVRRAHDLLEEITSRLTGTVPDLEVFGHIEPREDPRAWDDYDAEVQLPPRER